MASMNLNESKIIYKNNELSYKFNQIDQIMNKLIITFDKNIYNNVNSLNKGEVNITFKNNNDLNELLILLDMFFRKISTEKQIAPNLVIVFEINLNNKTKEEEIVQKLINTSNQQLKYEVVYKNDQQKNNEQENNKIIKKQEEIEKNFTATGTRQIKKENINNETKNYLEIDGKIYDDNQFSLSISEQKQELLKKWLEDPIKKSEISNLTPKELDIELTKIVTTTLKQYDLTSPTHEHNNESAMSNLSNKIAHEKDGKVNEELGIIENGAEDLNQFTTVEETRDNQLNIVTPTVTDQTINSNNHQNQNSVTYNNDNYQYQDNSNETEFNLEEEEISQREIENVFYIDYDMKTIYDINGNELGKLDPNLGYIIDENNNLTKNGEVLGPVDDIRNMNYQQQKNNVRKRILKNDGYMSFFMISMLISITLILYIIMTLY